jgi:hypothetical protein
MKLNHPLVKGTLKRLKPNIFGIAIPDSYDRGMLFCRYQEFYESPIKEFRGKVFTLERFMRVYAKWKGVKHFSYPSDWGGYNIPSEALISASELFLYSSNYHNEYDPIMADIIEFCQEESNDMPFYLIGVDSFELTADTKYNVMRHELSHGLYYTNEEYRNKCNELVSSISKEDYDFIKKELLKIGYVNDKKILYDETQAFLSTGLYGGLINKRVKKYTKKFQDNLKSHKI